MFIKLSVLSHSMHDLKSPLDVFFTRRGTVPREVPKVVEPARHNDATANTMFAMFSHMTWLGTCRDIRLNSTSLPQCSHEKYMRVR